MEYIFLSMLFVVVLATPLLMIKPEYFTRMTNLNWSRKKLGLFLLVSAFTLLIATGITADPVEKNETETEIVSNATVKADDNRETPLFDVLEIVDGDTIKVKISNEPIGLRMIGIDAPESSHPSKPVECFSGEATEKLKELLSGKRVRLEKDETQSNKDQYDRLLRYVLLEDGTNINKALIEQGYAFEYTYEVPYKYQTDFKNAENEARSSKKGLWAESACNGEREKKETPIAPSQDIPPNNPQEETPAAPVTPSTDAYYANCTEARNAGVAPIYRGDPGYRSALDRDDDGVACE